MSSKFGYLDSFSVPGYILCYGEKLRLMDTNFEIKEEFEIAYQNGNQEFKEVDSLMPWTSLSWIERTPVYVQSSQINAVRGALVERVSGLCAESSFDSLAQIVQCGGVIYALTRGEIFEAQDLTECFSSFKFPNQGEYFVAAIHEYNGRLFVALKTTQGNNAKICEWDGSELREIFACVFPRHVIFTQGLVLLDIQLDLWAVIDLNDLLPHPEFKLLQKAIKRDEMFQYGSFGPILKKNILELFVSDVSTYTEYVRKVEAQRIQDLHGIDTILISDIQAQTKENKPMSDFVNPWQLPGFVIHYDLQGRVAKTVKIGDNSSISVVPILYNNVENQPSITDDAEFDLLLPVGGKVFATINNGFYEVNLNNFRLIFLFPNCQDYCCEAVPLDDNRIMLHCDEEIYLYNVSDGKQPVPYKVQQLQEFDFNGLNMFQFGENSIVQIDSGDYNPIFTIRDLSAPLHVGRLENESNYCTGLAIFKITWQDYHKDLYKAFDLTQSPPKLFIFQSPTIKHDSENIIVTGFVKEFRKPIMKTIFGTQDEIQRFRQRRDAYISKYFLDTRYHVDITLVNHFGRPKYSSYFQKPWVDCFLCNQSQYQQLLEKTAAEYREYSVEESEYYSEDDQWNFDE